MILFVVIALSATSFASQNKVIDLGDIEVNGDVRKPFVQVVEADQNVSTRVPELSKEHLKSFETKLLQFAKPKGKVK